MKNFSHALLPSNIHFVGIGGVGMSGLARILKELNYLVTGSDTVSNGYTHALENLGIRVFKGHCAENIKHASCVVVSSAIAQANVEILEAKRRNIPIVHRSHILSWIMKFNFSISVSGSYGKSTTTSLIGQVLENGGYKPTVIVGATMNAHKTNAYLGEGKFCITEADESDASFLNLRPEVSVITNIDQEHINAYGSFAGLKDAFYRFMTEIPFCGFSVVCIDDGNICELVSKSFASGNGYRIITYGLDSEANVRGYNIRYGKDHMEYDVAFESNWIAKFSLQNVRLNLIGEHNIKNSLAALAVLYGMGGRVTGDCFKGYEGIKRRCTVVGFYKGAKVIDDYGVHPFAIKQVIQTLKRDFSGRLFVVWEPHRYSRVVPLAQEFFKAFNLADKLYVIPIFTGWEDVPEGFAFDEFLDSISSNCTFVESLELLEHNLALENLSALDTVLFLGAGNVTYWAQNLAKY
jgi:UDP-N-acetylmuramate--alanine ligase